MTNTQNNVIIGALVLFLLMIGLFLLGDQPTQPVVERQTVEEQPVVETQPEVAGERDYLYEGFMAGCAEDGSHFDSFCNCTYDHVVENHGREEIIEMAMELEKGNEPERMFEAVMQCIEHMPNN